MKFSDSQNEEILLEGIKNGNELILKRLYKLHFPMIENFVRLNGGNVQEAKDLFQEGFFILFKNCGNPSFKLNCKIKTYLYSVCRRLWLNELKRKMKAPFLYENYNESVELQENDIEDFIKLEGNIQHLEKCLSRLGEPCSSLLSDYYFGNLSMQEIAEKNGYTNADNAKNQKYKCLLRLKKIFFDNPVYNQQTV